MQDIDALLKKKESLIKRIAKDLEEIENEQKRA